jgi:hypothetical protein
MRAIYPDESLRYKLFHLAVFGEVLIALRNLGATTESLRPLSGSTRSGPTYAVRDPDGRRWQLWFESGGLGAHLNRRGIYAEATRGVRRQQRPLSADILLLREEDVQPVRALAFECKYYTSAEDAARDGYAQSAAYALELGHGFGIPHPNSFVVVPEPQAVNATWFDYADGRIGICPPSAIRAVIESVLS